MNGEKFRELHNRSFRQFPAGEIRIIQRNRIYGSLMAMWDVMAMRTISWFEALNESGEIKRAGRFFDDERSVNGNVTRTMSPRL